MATLNRDKNRISIYNLADPVVASELALAITDIKNYGYTSILIALDCEGIYPNCAVPVAAMIHSLADHGIEIEWNSLTSYATKSKIEAPESISSATSSNVLSHLWKFDQNENTSAFVSALREALTESIDFSADVLWGLEWALNEVMDNVLVHSSETVGYVMAQVHKTNESRPIAICVSDMGIGLKNSLSKAYPKIKSDYDAITAAIRQGVTRDRSIGQGNGLWGLSRIVASNKGRLAIRSGSAQLSLDPLSAPLGGQQSKFHFLGYERPGTSIDFQLQTNRAIDMRQILQLQNAVNFRLESACNDDEFLVVQVCQEGGTGTRKSGERLRTKVVNNLTAGAKGALIDFENVGVVTSSFADEFLGKMSVLLGFVQFNQRIRLHNIDEMTAQIIQRSITQRMAVSSNLASARSEGLGDQG